MGHELLGTFMAWDDLSDAWWMRPSPMNESRGGISAQAFQLGFQQRQQMLENSLMERRMKLAEDLQNAKVTGDFKKEQGFASIASVMAEIAAADGYADPKWQAKFWETASKFPQALDDPSIQGFIGQFKSAEHARLQSELAFTRAEAQRERDYNRLVATGMIVQGRKDVSDAQLDARLKELSLKYSDEYAGEPIGTRKIIKSEWSDEPTAVLTKVGEGKTPWHWQRWEDLNPQDQAAIRTKLGIGRDRLNLINKELAPLKAEKSKAKEGSSDWINAQKEIDRLERERAKIEEQMFRHKPTAVPVNPPAAAPAAAPAQQPLSVPSRQGVVAPTNVNEIVAPPWEETPQPMPEDEGTAQMLFPRPTTQEEFDLLPSGAKYTGKDGRIYRKP